MPLRILHLTNASETGGLSRYLLDLSGGLHQRGHSVSIAGQRGTWHDRFANAPCPWIDLPLTGGPLALRSAAKTLRAYLSQHPVDVLHTHYRRATLVARRAARGMGIPILYTIHLSGIPVGGWRRLMSDFGDHAHAPSRDARRWLIEDAKFPADKITYIPHGIDIARFPQRDEAAKQSARTALGISPSATVAAFVARLDFPKNPDWMLDVAEAASSIPDLKILIAGAGPDAASLKAAIEERKLSDRIQLLGEREVLPIYQAADALLLPSSQEGFGLVCAEAMCVGVPVLRTRTSGTEELIVEGVTGRSVEIDRDKFVSSAVKFLADRASLKNMGTSAANHIRANFPLDRQIDSTIRLYEELKAGNKTGQIR
jgi:glycosyltransferase involved in cell wall biosynthesis